MNSCAMDYDKRSLYRARLANSVSPQLPLRQE
jgi:hypothetical protein